MNAALEYFSSLLWSTPVLAAFLGTGVFLTVKNRFFQLRHPKLWLGSTLFSLFKDKNLRKSSDSASISQFQSLTSSLAACMGMGNIIGVAAAIIAGGPGAVFWMWVSAFFGMMTSCVENILGVRYRVRDEKGERMGGAMLYMERGLGRKRTAKVFAVLMALASFGIGGITQSNSMSAVLNGAFGIPPMITGSAAALICSAVIFGGVKRIAKVTEKTVPLVCAVFIVSALVVIAVNYKNLPSVFAIIFREAFSLKSAAGGAAGCGIKTAARYGISRGVFSNEAGLGSSATVHAAADVESPAKQGMWGMVEVFIDTLVMCTLSASVILSSGVFTGRESDPSALFSAAFSSVLGAAGDKILCLTLTLLGFTTLIGWSYYGERGAQYTFGAAGIKIYRPLFIICVLWGAVTSPSIVWTLSDILNCAMAMPNLAALIALSDEAAAELREFAK